MNVNATAPTQSERSLLEVLRGIVAWEFGVEAEDITPDASFATDLGVDSLEVMSLVARIEREFAVQIADRHVEEFETLRRVEALLIRLGVTA